jgi:hypothetical protein
MPHNRVRAPEVFHVEHRSVCAAAHIAPVSCWVPDARLFRVEPIPMMFHVEHRLSRWQTG